MEENTNEIIEKDNDQIKMPTAEKLLNFVSIIILILGFICFAIYLVLFLNDIDDNINIVISLSSLISSLTIFSILQVIKKISITLASINDKIKTSSDLVE